MRGFGAQHHFGQSAGVSLEVAESGNPQVSPTVPNFAAVGDAVIADVVNLEGAGIRIAQHHVRSYIGAY